MANCHMAGLKSINSICSACRAILLQTVLCLWQRNKLNGYAAADRYTVVMAVFRVANNNGHLAPRLPVKAGGFLLHRTMLKHELAMRNSVD